MKYKTTYFKISLNSEISVFKYVYEYRLNDEKLISEINKFESELIDIFKQYNIDLEINDLSISFLNEILNSEHDIYHGRGLYQGGGFYTRIGTLQVVKLNRSHVYSNIKNLISQKELQLDLSNQRFTNDHEQELNKHLNEIAEDGWKLFSMNPIMKGFKDYDFSNSAYCSFGYGYGHSVLEGFVLVWEKHE